MLSPFDQQVSGIGTQPAQGKKNYEQKKSKRTTSTTRKAANLQPLPLASVAFAEALQTQTRTGFRVEKYNGNFIEEKNKKVRALLDFMSAWRIVPPLANIFFSYPDICFDARIQPEFGLTMSYYVTCLVIVKKS